LILLAVFPFLILALYNGFAQRKQAARDVTEDALRIVRQARSELELPVEVARHLLTLLAKHPDLDQRRQGECIRTLKDLKIQFPMFNNFGVTDEQGNLYCSAVPSTGTVNMSDRLYFKGAKESGDFSGGDLQVGRNTGKHNIAYAYPILDKQRKFKGVVYMSIDPHAISRRLSQIPLSVGTEIRIIDRKGEILASNQDPKKWTGRDVSNEPFIKTILAKGEGTIETEGLDKVRRLYTFTTLTSAGTKELHFYAGIPTSVAYRVADQTLKFNLMVIGLIVLLALCGAWFGTNAMILRQMKMLISAAQRLASGDLGARTGVNEGAEEVRLLAQNFDSLAETLQQQDSESRRTEEQFKRRAAEESGLADLGARLQGKLSVKEVAQGALESLVQFLEASMGTLFVLEEDGLLHRKADYALPPGLTEQTSFPLGSGSIGQVAQSRQLAVTDAGNQTWRLTYGFGELTPSQIVTFPLMANEILIGVVELCFYDAFSEDQKEWLSKASVMVATALRFARESREREIAEERIQRIIEFMPNPVMVVDNQGRVVFWNRSMERITGMKKEDIIGKGDYEYALPFYGVRRPILVDLVGQWNEEIAKNYLSIRKEGDLLISESYHPHLGEGGTYLLSTATVFYDAAGQPSGAIEILRDITEQKRTEALMVEKEVAEEAAVKAEKARQEALAAQEELRIKIEEIEHYKGRLEQLVAERTEELKISEERSRQLLESADEGIFGLDAQGHLTLINPAALRMLGFSEAELLGQDIHSLIHHSHPDGSNYSAEECPITNSFTKGTTHQVSDEVLWRKDGSPFPVEYSSTAIRKDGRVVGAVVTFRDVSERKRVEEERRQYVEELEGFNKLIVGREEKMIELKEEINDMLVKMGQEKKYKIPDEE